MKDQKFSEDFYIVDFDDEGLGDVRIAKTFS
jgi:hypothetical protein